MLGQVYVAASALKMWHIAARQYAAIIGIKCALYNSFAYRKISKNKRLLPF